MLANLDHIWKNKAVEKKKAITLVALAVTSCGRYCGISDGHDSRKYNCVLLVSTLFIYDIRLDSAWAPSVLFKGDWCMHMPRRGLILLTNYTYSSDTRCSPALCIHAFG